MRSKTLLALLLLQWLLATCVSPTAAQLDPDETEVEGAGGGAVDEDAPKAAKVGEFLMDDQLVIVNKKIIRVNFVPGLRLNLNCSVGSGGTFYAWKKEFFVIDNNPVMFRTLNKAEDLGRYICVALPKMPDGKYKAVEFLVTEMPKDFVKKTVRSGEDIKLVCTKRSSTGTYKWYRFNPKKYTFEVVSGKTGQTYTMPYSSMSENNVDVGFTFYKCEPDSSTSQRDFFKLVKLPGQDTATGKPKTYYTEKLRTIDTDTGSIPTVVEPNSQVTFECYKVESGTSPAKWFFRGENTSSDLNYNEISTGYDIKTGADKSELVIRDCSVRNKGYYKCKVGGAIRYAFLDIEVIVPSIHEYSKGEYNMDRVSGVDNELGCEIPIGGNPADVVWRITPTTGSPYSFGSNGEKPPFKSSVKTKGANQLVTLTFLDNKALKGYKVECCLGDEADFVFLTTTPKKKPVVVLNRENEGYTVASCKQDTKLAQVKFHQNDKINEPIGPSMNPQLMSPTEQYYFVSEKNLWIRCSGLNSSSIRIFSDPVPLYENPPSVTIEVTGQVIQPNGRSARIAGKPVDIVCRFNNTNSTFASVDTVKLQVEGTIVAYKPVKVGEGVFKFRLTKTTPENSGKHQCLNDIQARTPRHYRIVSDVITLNWCLPNQFVCDGKCMSSSIKCNGTKECKDGTDELQSMCVPCEPNEVPCVTWKGKEPERQCVLKHWLCDATDDCGNNYDEESPLSKKWCTPTCVNNPSLSCPSNSTCCSNENKCIPRAYECDREQDCADGSDEGAARCCNLVISQPTDSQIRNATKGSRVTLTCKAVGFERPTISWRCNWGHLRSPERMTESNRVESRGSDGQYVVIGTLEISNFTEADNCIYNCEAVTKCKSELSPEITLQVI